MNRIKFSIFLFLTLFILSACSTTKNSTGCQFSDNPDTIKVCTTLFPQYDFAKAIGGEYVEVALLLKPGTEPHSYEPKTSEIIQLNKSDLFIYTNELMEPWVVNKIMNAIENDELVILNASNDLTLIETNHESHGHEDEEHDEEHIEENLDPHVWTSIPNAIKMIDTITDTLSEISPEHAPTFQQNADSYKERLSNLNDKFIALFSTVEHKEIIHGGHAAMGYFAYDYDLEIHTVFESYSPNEELKTSNIIELVKLIKETKIDTIYHEELIDSQTARVIKDEVAKEGITLNILILHGLHNVSQEELREGVTYERLMEQNYKNLKVGLDHNE